MKNKSRKKYFIILLIITCVIVIGCGVLSSSLTINGQTSFGTSPWNIKFQNIVLDSSNNVTATTSPSITDNTNVNFAVTLSKPGDKFSFTVDAVNTGTTDAMISAINKSSLTTDQAKYLDYTVTYSDGVTIQEKDKLVKTTGLEKIKISINFKTDIVAEDLPTSGVSLNLMFSINYVQADSTAQVVVHTLDDFITLAKSGESISDSYVGRTFTVNLGTSYGDHTLRVANVSTPSECSNAGFSQTACGVVLEFADIVYASFMNDSNTNVGGWPAMSLHSSINNNIYNVLPSNLKNAIIDTTVVSSHGTTSGETNFVTTDKLYLLSAHEVWIDEDGDTSNGIDFKDSSYNNTRQLDYYASKNTTTTSYSPAIKKNGSTGWWWLRSTSNSNLTFLVVCEDGDWYYHQPILFAGVSPAFRIA